MEEDVIQDMWAEMSDDEKNKYLEDLVEWKFNLEKISGLRQNPVTFNVSEGYWLRMSYVIEGNLTVNEICPIIAFMDSENHLLLRTNLFQVSKESFNGFDTMECSIAVEPKDVRRIVIYNAD